MEINGDKQPGAIEAMAFVSVCDLDSNTNIWTQGERGEEGLMVNPQGEPNKEELSKHLSVTSY